MPAISVQFVLFPNLSILDLAGPMDVFLTANHLSGQTAYDLSCISVAGEATLEGGLSLLPVAPRSPVSPHTLIVPGGPSMQAFCDSPEFSTVFVPLLNGPGRIASVCTGAYALAQAGVLLDRKATTHWASYDDFERMFPAVRLQRGPIFVKDGPIWTSAGVTAGIDLALAMVEEDLGHAIALRIARHLVMFLKRPGDQSQFSAPLALQAKGGRFSDLLAWISSNLAADLSVPALARQAGMSDRSFLRHFTAQMGAPPGKVVETLRLDVARDLLSTSGLSVKDVAGRCGYQNEATFLRRFSARYGITPSQHRERFGSNLETE